MHEVSLTPDGARSAFAVFDTAGLTGEEVHVIEVASGSDRVVAADKQGCIQPMVACVNCFFTCVNTPHISPDGSRVLYSVRRQNPFYVVNSDGTGLAQLPIYSGALAPGPQRVISRSGQVVFTSSAPFGPTFAATPADVYLMDLAGGNIRNVTNFKDASLYAVNATISADGSLIAFQSNMQPGTNKAGDITQVWVVKPDSSGLRPLTGSVTCLALQCPKPGGQMPAISGDGSLVAYLNGDYPSGNRIFVVRSDGSGSSPQVRLDWSSTNNPVLSDDGSTLIFTTGPKSGDGRGAIYASKSDGSSLHPVYAPPALNQNGVTGITAGASPAAGGLISIYGYNFSKDGLFNAASFPLPRQLGSLSLLVNGIAVPLLAVTPWQINALLPQDVTLSQTAFEVHFSDSSQAAATSAQAQAASPAIFTYSYGTMEVVAAFNWTRRQIIDPAHPAAAGHAIEVYGTGLGMTIPMVAAGQPSPLIPLAVVPGVEMNIGGVPAQVLFAGLTPGLAGVYQVNAIVPAGLKPGNYVLQWKVAGVTSAGFGSLAIQ